MEAAFKRKTYMKELADDEIPSYHAYGAKVAQIDPATLDETARRRAIQWQKCEK